MKFICIFYVFTYFFAFYIFTSTIFCYIINNNINMIKYLIGIDGKSNLNDIFKRVRDGVSLIRLVLMKNIPEPLTEQLRFSSLSRLRRDPTVKMGQS